jgi:methionyl aminopeptidase
MKQEIPVIYTKTNEEIEKIRECGAISSNLFTMLEDVIKPGVTTLDVDAIAEEYIRDHGAVPSFKGYSDFPSSICASVNEEIIHGLPSRRALEDGDVAGIDVGVQMNGVISDSARTFRVGSVSKEVDDLLNRTEEALFRAIFHIRHNCQINDIGGTIEDFITPFGYGIVREYCGHGVGYKNHEEPEIPNYRYARGRRKLKKGMVIAIEPMINLGDSSLFVLEDGWTVVTIDGKFSAHFEHTVAITENGYDILTLLPEQVKAFEDKYGSRS